MPTPIAPLPEPLPSAARERVVEVLTHHFANDELTEAELDARLQRVYAATTSRELDAITADLPSLPDATPPVGAGQATDITALCSGQERALAGVVPHALRLRARLGYVELDLTHATFQPGVTTIDVRAFMGYVQIHFPAGVRVHSAGRALFGFFSVKGAGTAEAGEAGDQGRLVRITGRAALGFAEANVAS
jgi:Domain of unknown function (DUF1707)/Cell wall-active antibiotics response 4TMS YvqF